MKTIKGKITGIAITGAFELEGHSVILQTWKNDETQIKIRESYRGNSWQTHGKNWSTSRVVPTYDAIEEQEKLLKHGYQRMN